MPEGDTIFRAARALNGALAGRVIAHFESAYPALTRVDEDRPLAGRTVRSVSSRGKHVLMVFSGDLVLRTHMRMNGSWHIYRTGERWQRPSRDMRIVVATDTYVAVGFNIPVAEFLTTREVDRHPQLTALGPDLATGSLDPLARAEVRSQIRARGSEAIADVLLDQRVIAGIGNVLKSEILFASGVYPFAPAAALDENAIDRVLDVALRLMAMNVVEGSKALTPASGRRTTGRMDPAAKLWVYGRGGRPCRRCGTAIEGKKTGRDARITYWCPRCQARA